MSPPGIEAAAERSELIRGALETARRAHAGQVRNGSGGMPYIDHPVAVAELLDEHGFGEEVLAAALLHDVVEDSEISIEEVRERFGEPVARLVGALTDDEAIEPYERRKEEHRRRVAEAGPNAMAIYAADKLTNVRTLRRAYAADGEAVGGEFKAPLDVKIDVWEADLGLLRDAVPDLPFLDELEAALKGLRADRAGGGTASGSLNRRRCSGSRYQSTANIASAAVLVTTVATVPNSTSVISMIAPVIASARKPRPAIAKRFARKTRCFFC